MTEDDLRVMDDAALAREAGTDVPTIRRLVDIGVIERTADGFSPSDVQRVAVALAYAASGIGFEDLEQHIRAERMTFAYVDRIYPGRSPRSGTTVADLEAELGVPGVVIQLHVALGLAQPAADQELREADVTTLRAFIDAWRPSRGWPETMYRAARLVGDPMRRAVEGWVALFGETIAVAPERAAHMTVAELMPLVMEPGMRLAATLHPTTAWLADRNLERALNALNVEAMERALVAEGLRSPPMAHPPAVVFADLSGFTALTETQGDERAARHAADLSALASGAAAEAGGRLVKELGDGVMMIFPSVSSAAEAAVALLTVAKEAELPPVHVGISAGPLVERDGDYYGHTVNLAARLSAAAEAGEVLLTEAAAAGLADFAPAEPAGQRSLKGLADPVVVYRLVVDSPGGHP